MRWQHYDAAKPLITLIWRISLQPTGAGTCLMAMKPRHSFASKVLLVFVFVCAISIGPVAQGRPGFGRLVVQRAPNFGWNLAYNLEIDGVSVATVAQGHRYDAWLPAGPHVLTVRKVPSIGFVEPTSIPVNIQPGWLYLFSATWDSSLVFLRPAGVWLSPGELWQLRP